MKYLKKELVIDILNAAAAQAVRESSARHPEDIEIAMSSTMQGAAVALGVAARMGLFTDEATE